MIKQKIQFSEDVPSPLGEEFIFYPKSDGYYYKDSKGNEHSVGSSAPIMLTRDDALVLMEGNQLKSGGYYYLTDQHIALIATGNNSFKTEGAYILTKSMQAFGWISIDEILGEGSIGDIVVNGVTLFNEPIVFSGEHEGNDVANFIANAVNNKAEETHFAAFACASFVCIIYTLRDINYNDQFLVVVNPVNISFSPTYMRGYEDSKTEIMPCIYDINNFTVGENILPGFLSQIFDTKRKVTVEVTEDFVIELGYNPVNQFDFMNPYIINCRFTNIKPVDKIVRIPIIGIIEFCEFANMNFGHNLFVGSNIIRSSFSVDISFNIFWNNSIRNSNFSNQGFSSMLFEGLTIEYNDSFSNGTSYMRKDMADSTGTICGIIPNDFFIYEAIASFGEFDIGNHAMIGIGEEITLFDLSDRELINKKFNHTLNDFDSYSIEDLLGYVTLQLDNAQSGNRAIFSLLLKFTK